MTHLFPGVSSRIDYDDINGGFPHAFVGSRQSAVACAYTTAFGTQQDSGAVLTHTAMELHNLEIGQHTVYCPSGYG